MGTCFATASFAVDPFIVFASRYALGIRCATSSIREPYKVVLREAFTFLQALPV